MCDKCTVHSVSWVKVDPGNPIESFKDMVVGGREGGKLLYVVKARCRDGTLPGKLVEGGRLAYITGGGKQEWKLDTFKVLVAPQHSLSWVPSSGDSIPPYALPGGRDMDCGSALYIGRAKMDDKVICGNVDAMNLKCYVHYRGKEYSFDSYEILVLNSFGLAFGLEVD